MGMSRTTPELVSSLAPDHREFGRQNIEALLAGKPRIVCEHKLTRMWSPPGSADNREADIPAWILAISFPVYEEGKRLITAYVVDISAQKYAEEIQYRHAAAAELAKQNQERFMDITSHEMRNPLTAMMQLAESIARSMDSIEENNASKSVYKAILDQNVEAANTILTCTAHQRRIIDDVLILSRLESNMLSLTPSPEQLSTLLANTVKMFDGEVAMSDVKIELVKDASCDQLNADHILCDASRLMQILINLVGNAIKFTGKRAKRHITVTYGVQRQRPDRMQTDFGPLEWLRRRPESGASALSPAIKDGEIPLYVCFRIRDTGTGVKPAEMDKLFKRFSQASSKTHANYGGTGLGLYICRELVEKMGGEVGVASRYDEGSVFAFYIETRHVEAPEARLNGVSPLIKEVVGMPDLPQSLATTDETRKVPIRARVSPTLPRNGDDIRGHVLLVEDNLINQKLFAKALGRVGFEVSVANHGVEALEALEKSGRWRSEQTDGANKLIDLVLLDIEMPVMGGLECSRRIRDLEEAKLCKPLPIIAITANVREAQVTAALDAGMNDVLLKPFTTDDLVQKIRKMMEHGGEG